MLRRLLLVSVFAGLMAALVPLGSANAAACWGPTCNGRDPQTTRCSSGAYNLEEDWDVGGYVSIQLRYSPSCNAAWTRIENFRGWTGEAKIIGYHSGTYTGYRKTLAAYVGEIAWTPMVSFTYLVYGCYRYYHPTWGPQEWCSDGY